MFNWFRSLREKKGFAVYLFHLPTLVVLFLITLYPFMYVLSISFKSLSLSLPGHVGQFVGLANYRQLMSDSSFWESALITLRVIGVAIPIEMVLGMGIALVLNQEIRGRRFFTSLVLVPMMIAPVAVGLVGIIILQHDFGILPYAIKTLGVSLQEPLLGSVKTALLTVTLIDIWQWTPFVALIMLAGLRSQPFEPLEAAKIDGASSTQIFRYITLPLLSPLMMIAILLRSIDCFKMFDKVYVLTKGGPASTTELVSLYAFRVNFIYWNMGYGAAIVLVMFLIVLVATDLFFVLTQRGEFLRRR